MTPIEIRTVTAEDTLGLGAGGHARQRSMFAVNVDGPWPRREDELAAERVRLEERMGVGRTAGGNRPSKAFTPAERFVAGARDASRWTFGCSPMAPFSDQARSVSFAAVAEVVAVAERLLTGPPAVRHYADGVRAWLLWITGGVAVMEYRHA